MCEFCTVQQCQGGERAKGKESIFSNKENKCKHGKHSEICEKTKQKIDNKESTLNRPKSRWQ